MALKPYAVANKAPAFAVIELFGGDNNLSDYVEEDMNEMVLGATGDIVVIGLADVFNGPAKVVEISGRSGIRVLEELGEIDTGDPDVLAHVIARALVTYSGRTRLAIGFWDHGSGVFDETDRSPLQRVFPGSRLPRWRVSRSRPARRLFFADKDLMTNVELRAMLHDDQSGGLLTNREAGLMLKQAFDSAGRSRPVDLIFSDTCLNGMVEVAAELHPFAEFIVGSEDLEPGDGWDYYEWMSRVSRRPPPNAETWAVQAVDAMNAGYVSKPEAHPVTLSAVRSGNGVADAFKALIQVADTHGRDGFRFLDWARSQSQQFASGYDSYDLLDFVGFLTTARDIEPVAEAAERLASATRAAIVRSIALGPTVERATGLAFWFPGSRGSFLKDRATYATLAFDIATGWSVYLAAHR